MFQKVYVLSDTRNLLIWSILNSVIKLQSRALPVHGISKKRLRVFLCSYSPRVFIDIPHGDRLLPISKYRHCSLC